MWITFLSVTTFGCILSAWLVPTDLFFADVLNGYHTPSKYISGPPPCNWRDGHVGHDQMSFIRAVGRIVEKYDVQVMYDVAAGPMLWDHVLPLFHVLPGTFINVTAFEPVPRDGHRHVLILSTCENFHGEVGRSFLWIDLPHGIDEDILYSPQVSHMTPEHRGSRGFPPLQFARYFHEHCRATRKAPYWAAQLDPRRETVAYLATTGEPVFDFPAFVAVRAPQIVSEAVGMGLRRLAKDHNVIIRPHPDSLDRHQEDIISDYDELCPECIVDLPGEWHDSVDAAGLADVVIMEPSSVAFPMFHFLESKPVVVLQRKRERYEYLRRDAIMNSTMAEIVFPDEANDEEFLVQAVSRAKAMVGPLMVQARKEYVKRYNGDIDGYEEYRVALQLLRKVALTAKAEPGMRQDVGDLEQMFERFSSMPLSAIDLNPPRCDNECLRLGR